MLAPRDAGSVAADSPSSVTLRCLREAQASKGDGPINGRSSFEARR